MYQINQKEQKLLNKHLQLVIDKNKKVNITRIQNFQEGQLLHIEDSLAGVPLINKLPEGSLCDMGSGAGFPGIPIAICTTRDVTLIESVKKKAHILEEFAEELSLSNLQIYSGRTEELALSHPDFEIATARALSSLPSLLELASPLLRIQGYFLAYKSDQINEELEQALSISKKVGMDFIERHDYVLSDNKTKRSLLLFQKVSEPEVTLPRRSGMAQKRPYK